MKYSKEWINIQEFNDIINHPDISRRDVLIISILYYCALHLSKRPPTQQVVVSKPKGY